MFKKFFPISIFLLSGIFSAAENEKIERRIQRDTTNANADSVDYDPATDQKMAILASIADNNDKNQCNCGSQTGTVSQPTVSTCLKYDRRMQAASLEEAIVHFPDLTSKIFEDESPGSSPNNIDRAMGENLENMCPVDDDDCSSCSFFLMQRLQSVGMLQNQNVSQLQARLGIKGHSPPEMNCNRLRHSMEWLKMGPDSRRNPEPNEDHGKPKEHDNDEKSKEHDNDGKSKEHHKEHKRKEFLERPPPPFPLLAPNSAPFGWPPPPGRGPHGGKSRKRRADSGSALTLNESSQILNGSSISLGTNVGNNSVLNTDGTLFTGAIAQPAIGKRYLISCYKRGDILNGTNSCGLCNFCWAWLELPENYYPRYINELLCESDRRCLSGYGSCKQVNQSMTVYKNIPGADQSLWPSVNIPTGVTCSCGIESGSLMYSIAKG